MVRNKYKHSRTKFPAEKQHNSYEKMAYSVDVTT